MTPESCIAHYRIVSRLGKGGMGEVWRATDTKLNREVAIKVLPAAFACDPERMARFTREAQVLASLNHPNIAAIYGVEERALVMELVEGETLPAGLPAETALNYARQITDALEYAHERGIVHRDLKPANIKVTPEGRVKVLDFGLAKAVSRDAAPGDPESSPTLTLGATVAGVMLGTPAYMAPEQARGQLVDRRADIWAFGVVLYEMLTGRRLFNGETVSDTLAGVLKGEIDLRALRQEVRPVVERCLRRDPKLRWRSIGDVFLALEEGVGPTALAETAANGSLQRATPWIALAAVLAIVAAVAGIGWWSATRPVDHPLTRLDLDLGPNVMIGLNTTVAISPDGRRIVFPVRRPDGRQVLATRLLDQPQPTLLPGTENSHDAFFSPDGQWIGFFASSHIEKISAEGGAPVALAAFGGTPMGASWGSDGNIIAALGALVPLSRIPASAGQPQPLTRVSLGEATQRWPQFLPGGHAILFTTSNSPTSQENADIEALSLESGQTKVVQRGGYYGRYLPTGHLVYVHRGVLFGVPFDVDRLEVRGTPAPLLEDLAANPATGGAQFDFSWGPSGQGTYVYVSGKSAAQGWQVAWLDSSSKVQNVLATPGVYAIPRLSSDGRKLAFGGVGPDVYVTDLDRDTTTRLTFTEHSAAPVWAPDGKHLVFQSSQKGFSIPWIRADGAGEPQSLLETQNVLTPWSFSPDGGWLAYFERGPETGFDIWTLPLDLTDPDHPKPGKPELFLRTPADEYLPRFSPDGRWIAYRSDESGSFEIYVRPFRAGAPHGSGGKWQISSGGGSYALWAQNGHELFYETADNRIMVVDYAVSGDSFVPGKPRPWSDKQLFYAGTSNLDLAPDGKRFIVLNVPETAAGEKGSVHVVMMQNFFDYVKRRIPVK